MTVNIKSLLDHLNNKQQQAVLLSDGPLLIVAGPGSGKTRVLVHKIAYLLATGVEPWQVLAVTFTNKAALEMKSRASQLIGEQANYAWIATFHKTCGLVLRKHFDEAGLKRNFTIATTSEQKTLMKNMLKERNIKPDASAVSSLLSAISTYKNKLIMPEDLEKSPSPRERNMAEHYQAYNEKLKEANCIDFDDMLVKTLQLFRSYPDIAEVYKERFKYVLVDEFQDTNAPQYEIIKILTSKHRNICVVGDMDQLIYTWRNASTGIMYEFKKDFTDLNVVTLNQNYRSTKNIIDASMAVIEKQNSPFRADLWTDNPQGEAIKVAGFSDAQEEAEWIAEYIKKDVQKTNNSLSDYAILYRTNAQSRLLEKGMLDLGIRTILIGSQRFYDRAEIKDVISYLQVLANPDDINALSRAVGSPRRGIGPIAISEAVEAARGEGVSVLSYLYKALKSDQKLKSKKGWESFISDCLLLKRKLSEGLPELVEAVLELPGFRSAIRSKGELEYEDRINNINELVNSTYEFLRQLNTNALHILPENQTRNDLTNKQLLTHFLEHISLLTDVEVNEDTLAPAVQLMTIHAAKGKEFKTVFVVGVEDGILPHEISKDDPESEKEERRLLFVAMTRAMENLFITHTSRRMFGGRWDTSYPSPYLRSLPATVEKITAMPTISYQKSSKAFSKPFKNFSPPVKKQILKRDISIYKVGQEVLHSSFGLGEILNIRNGIATIRFDKKERVLDLSIAPLTLKTPSN